MKPLSVFAFLKGSISKVLPMVITVCLAVGLLTFLSLFLIKMDEQIKEANSYPMENMSFIAGGKSGIPVNVIEELKNKSGDVQIFFADIRDVVYKTIIGGTGSSIYLLEQKDIKTFMKIEDFALRSGRLPQKPYEIILHKKIALNYSLRLGSVIKKRSKGWQIDHDIKVVGMFDGKGVMGIGLEDEGRLKPGLPYVSVAVAGKDIARANEYIDKNLSSRYQIWTSNTVSDFLNNFNGPIAAMKIFIGIVLVGALGVFLANITSIQYSVRKKELELLYAVGYTRKYIIGKALKEIGLASIGGYVFGISLSLLLTWILNVCFLTDKGLDMPLISAGSMLDMLLVPLAITIFSMIAPLKASKFKNLA